MSADAFTPEELASLRTLPHDNHRLVRRLLDEVQRLTEELDGHREAQESRKALIRELDVILSGPEGAAKQASLCDLIGPAKELRAELARRSDAGRVEVPDLPFAEYQRRIGSPELLTAWFRENARLSPSPQPSADVVVVPREEWEHLKRNHLRRMIDSRTDAEIRAWKTFRASDRNLRLGAATPRSEQITKRLDRFVAKCEGAIRSSTNHDAQDAGEGR